MTKKTGTVLVIILTLALVGTGLYLFNNKKERKEVACINGETAIYEYYKTAVVLVKHKFSYKISIKHGEPFILDIDDVSKEISGTGFFVSADGKIVTNRHVVQPWENVTYDPTEYLKLHISSILPDSVPAIDAQAFLEKHWEEYYDDEVADGTEAGADSVGHVAADTGTAVVAKDSVQNKGVSGNVLMVKQEDIEITPTTDEISVALHGSTDEWLPCKLVTFAKGEGIDIGVLQLKDKTLPASVEHLIDMKNAVADDASLKPGNKAVLIGYPLGTDLANTRKGIMVQAYEGQINKESDGINIQYNVTSTHGASGSPVFNECGQLIAVNFAGIDQTQGYNFGIVAKYAQELVK
ncbi:S1 family peptidase [Chitinophagaceae bacterium MMS25-I14]